MSLAADPWNIGGSSTSDSSDNSIHHPSDVAPASLQFEDNFELPEAIASDNNLRRQAQGDRLPDSDNYLAALERKLRRLKTNPTVLQQLAERREACMQHLLNDAETAPRFDSAGLDVDLDEPVNSHELLRFIRPEQALSVAELVHLVKYDHLEPNEHDQQQQQDSLSSSVREGDESGTESTTSR